MYLLGGMKHSFLLYKHLELQLITKLFSIILFFILYLVGEMSLYKALESPTTLTSVLTSCGK